MNAGRPRKLPLLLALATGCAAEAPLPALTPAPAAPPPLARPDEPQLPDLRRLTFGGENAEAYWSWDGTQLIFQAREGFTGQSCDRIYRMPPMDSPPRPVPVSSGKGTTTCSYFLPGDQ